MMLQLKNYLIDRYRKPMVSKGCKAKYFVLLLLFCVTQSVSFGQSIKRHVIGSLGSFHQGTNIKVNTTFGQPPNAGTISNASNYLRQGFQQPICLYAPQAAISASSDTQCLPGNVFNFSYPLVADSFTNYQWTFGQGANTSISTTKNPQGVSFNTPGIKVIGLVVKRGGCRDSASFQIVVVDAPSPNAPIIAIGNDTLCIGSSTTITATDTTGAVVYFNFYDSLTNGNLIGSSPLTVSPTTTTTYYLEVKNQFGCTNVGGRFPVTITVAPIPTVTLTSDKPDNTFLLGETVTFTADPSGYPNYEFLVNNVSAQSGSSNIFSSNTLSDNDTVSVIASDNGCASLKAEVVVRTGNFPNAFTPNGDGKNDVFLKNYDLTILNRWGQELYTGLSGWDGTYNGKRVSPGTYFYIVKQNNNTIKGTVAVVEQ